MSDFARSIGLDDVVLERFWAKVDKSGDCWEWTAGKLRGGYGQFHTKGKMRTAHRLSFQLSNGPVPEGLVLDHMCHNTSCVNPEHLRAVSVKQNGENSRGRKDSTSGVRGVSWDTRVQLWKVAVRHHDLLHHGGYFKELTEAGAAAVALRNKLFTHNDEDR